MEELYICPICHAVDVKFATEKIQKIVVKNFIFKKSSWPYGIEQV